MLRKGKIPPQASFKSMSHKLPLLDPTRVVISNFLETWDVPMHAAMVNSYSAGGSNASLICCEFSRASTSSQKSGWWLPNRNRIAGGENESQAAVTELPVLVSGASMSSLLDNCGTLAAALQAGKNKPETPSHLVEDVLFTLGEKRQRHSFRFSITVPKYNLDHLINVLQAASSSKVHDIRITEVPLHHKPII